MKGEERVFYNKKKYLLLGGLVLLWILALPSMAMAGTDISVNICDPDKPQIAGQQVGNTVYSVLSSPQLTYGSNRELGTIRVSGKAGVAVPVQPGQKIKITLPLGTRYMQIPTINNYKNYVEWPAAIDGQANQINDQVSQPAMKFIAGSPRTLTLQFEGIDTTAPIMVLDFVFNKADYSMVKMAPFLESVDQYSADPNGQLSRLEFFKLLADVNVPFSWAPFNSAETRAGWDTRFTDLKDVPAADLVKIKPLLESGLVSGYPDGRLLAGQAISRGEAASLAGRVFLFTGQKASFKDPIPVWAVEDIDSAVSGRNVTGNFDGSLQAERLLSKAEALSILQNCLESYNQD